MGQPLIIWEWRFLLADPKSTQIWFAEAMLNPDALLENPVELQIAADSRRLLESAIEANLQKSYEERINAHENARQLAAALSQAGRESGPTRTPDHSEEDTGLKCPTSHC